MPRSESRKMANSLRMSVAEFNARELKKKPRIKNVKRKMVNGIEFDSTKEARCWQDLCLMQQAGQITELRRQVPFQIVVCGNHICQYTADFTFRKAGRAVVMDAKGFRTEIFKLKRKLMIACHGVEIEEV